MNSFLQAGRFWTSVRVAITFVTFALITNLALIGCSGPTSGTSSGNDNSPKPNAGQPPAPVTANNPNPAPPVTIPLPAAMMNTALKSLDGNTFKLADFRGKVVLVNLWATWCGPCRSEIPDLIKVSQEYKARGVEVIGLTNEDPERDEKKVQDFVTEFRITYKIGWSDQSVALGLMQGQVRNTIPQSFVISRDGRVVKRFVGFNQYETPVKLRQALEEAVNEKQG